MTDIPRPSLQSVRFFVTASAGLVVDICVALLLARFLTLSDIPAAAAGLGAGMVFNYFVHQAWTFRMQDTRPSVRQFLHYALSVLVTLAVRGGFLGALAAAGMAEHTPTALRFFLGAALSFGVSYTLCRNFVFAQSKAVTP